MNKKGLIERDIALECGSPLPLTHAEYQSKAPEGCAVQNLAAVWGAATTSLH